MTEAIHFSRRKRRRARRWTRRWVRRTLRRIDRVWVRNPLALLEFAWRLAMAVPYGLREIGSPQWGKVAIRWTRQIFRTFIRGIALVAMLGVAGALGIGAVTRLAGTFLRPLLESVVLPILVRDLAPLGLAVALAGRMGASITAKLAVLPARRGVPAVQFQDRELNERVVPQLLAGLVTAPVFFLLLGWFLLAGYETAVGSLSELVEAEATRFFQPALWTPLADGLYRSIVFGGIVSFVASTLGVGAAEHDSRTGEAMELNDAVWEASVISVVLCSAVTIFSLLGMENP